MADQTETDALLTPAEVAALFRELGIHHLLTPMPVTTDFPVVQHFVEQWTAPSGQSYGRFELRNVLATPLGPAPNTVPAGPGGYDDSDPKIEYTGVWIHDHQFTGPFSGSITYSEHPGDSARLFFDGRTITYVFTKALNRGTADVLIDRRLQAQIDEYTSGIQWSQKMVFSGLKPGPHTIEIRVAGKKNATSSGYYVDVDRLIVEK